MGVARRSGASAAKLLKMPDRAREDIQGSERLFGLIRNHP
jgi:hypothetical protein